MYSAKVFSRGFDAFMSEARDIAIFLASASPSGPIKNATKPERVKVHSATKAVRLLQNL
jgi:hypothetical protein